MNNENIIIAIATGLLTWLATRTKSHYDLRAKKIESDSSTEGIYVQNMEMILKEYKEQVSAFRTEVRALKDENKDIRKQLEELKSERSEIIEEFNKERTYYERELELKDEIIDELNVQIAEKDEIIGELRRVKE
jgi:predicted RNase H-like nuclease (RuvC/YqgF family)